MTDEPIMEQAEVEVSAWAIDDPAPEGLRITFFLLAVNFDRVFDSLLESLLNRGHKVQVVIQKRKDSRLPSGGGAALERLNLDYTAFSHDYAPPLHDRWLRLRTQLRLSIDYLRYLEPDFRDAWALRERARARAPLTLSKVAPALRSSTLLRGTATKLLRRLERATPIGAATRDFLRGCDPDVVLVSPLVGLGSRQSDLVRLAREFGVPSVLPVASWDNLTNKGVLKEVPSLTIVWNEAQAEEATRYHGVPRDRVVVSGAHAFDHWFDWQPSSERAEFVKRAGLDDRPYVLYACSSSFVDRGEQEFVAQWIQRLRTSDEGLLRGVGVLVRPHPTNARHWVTWRSADPGTVVWPREGVSPTDRARRSEYFDTIYHATAVVGINTSAFIDAAIVGRPSFTLLDERFRAVQEETLHFAHLSGPHGLLVVASSWTEHLQQLTEVLTDPRRHDERLERFVREFVRPQGIDEPSAPRAARAIETLALGSNASPLGRSAALPRAIP